ncbi:transposable element Tcb2 transposase [Trichonephila clavipes]|nr:transposable element Tcb2 transposase [Trichonephila clavipes]
MTGALLAPCHDEFHRPRSDYVRQVSLAATHNTFVNEKVTGCRRASGSETCHFHEDQAQDTLDRPVVEKTGTSLSSEDNRVRVWRLNGERLNHAVALQRHTAPTAGVMEPFFQQGNAQPYTARESQDFPLLWPARSPDLSSTEYIWDHLGRRVWFLTSMNELESRLQQIWNETSQDIQNLYASMPDRFAPCIRARWGLTRY